MLPIAVATAPARWRRRGLCRVAVEPLLDDVVVELLRPQKPRERLSHDALRVFAQVFGDDRRVELVGLAPPHVERALELLAEGFVNARRRLLREAQTHDALAARRDRQDIARRGLRAAPFGVDGTAHAADDVIIYPVLRERAVRRGVETARVRVVLREEKLRLAFAVEIAFAVKVVRGLYDRGARVRGVTALRLQARGASQMRSR